MSRELLYRSVALTDLDGIFDFIANHNPVRAGTYIDDIQDACAQLRDTPMMGVARPAFGHEVRVLNLWRRIVVVYQVGPDAVTILRVFGAGRDYEALMRQDA